MGLQFEDLLQIYEDPDRVPETILQTDRLLIRESTAGDFPLIRDLLREASADSFPADFDRQLLENREDYLRYLAAAYGFFGFGYWSVELKETGQLAGWCGFQPLDGNERTGEGLELGYLICPQLRGLGYGYEACMRLLSFAWEELEAERIILQVHKNNPASERLADKLGFHLWRQEDDVRIYQLLSSE